MAPVQIVDSRRRELLRLVIPLVPPSVNHYLAPNRPGSRKRYHLTKDAAAFKDAVCLFTRGQFVQAKAFRVDYVVFVGKGKRGDKDNFSKLILDGLASAGAFRNLKGEPVSDAWVTEGDQRKDRDAKNPRTEITITAARNQQ